MRTRDWKARAEAAERKLGTAQAQMQEAQMKQLAAEEQYQNLLRAGEDQDDAFDRCRARVQELEEALEMLRDSPRELPTWARHVARAALDQHGLSEGNK